MVYRKHYVLENVLFSGIIQNHWKFMFVFGWETIVIHEFSENDHLYSVSDIERTRIQKMYFFTTVKMVLSESDLFTIVEISLF